MVRNNEKEGGGDVPTWPRGLNTGVIRLHCHNVIQLRRTL